MIDLHTHTLHSDGVLIPSELVARASARGYTAIAITDHADSSNLEDLIRKTVTYALTMKGSDDIQVIAGVELTHMPPQEISGLVKKSRELGASLVVMHGQTIVEPVAPGTNLAAIKAGVDILAHPGLVTEQESKLAAEMGVCFEITARRGHSLTNGHVAVMARRYGVSMVLNTDAHSPGDLITDEFAEDVALGAGLSSEDFDKIKENTNALLKKINP